ncbi:MAG: hypothetical protein ACOYB2_07455 [Limnohabitans sp.]
MMALLYGQPCFCIRASNRDFDLASLAECEIGFRGMRDLRPFWFSATVCVVLFGSVGLSKMIDF